jgi:hypothetical protein
MQSYALGNNSTQPQSQTHRPDLNNKSSMNDSLRDSDEEDFSFLNDFQNDYNEINTNQNEDPIPFRNNYLAKNFMRFHGKLETIKETNSDVSNVKSVTFDNRSVFSQSNTICNGIKVVRENTTTNSNNELIKQIRNIFLNGHTNEFNNDNNNYINNHSNNMEEEYNGRCWINNSGRNSEKEIVVNFTRKIMTYQKRNITCEITESNHNKGNGSGRVTSKYTITFEDCIKQTAKGNKHKSKFGFKSNSSKILLSPNDFT